MLPALAPPASEEEAPSFDDTLAHWQGQIEALQAAGKLSPALVWQASRECIEALAGEAVPADDDVPQLLAEQNAAVGAVVGLWREWVGPLGEHADPQVRQFAHLFGATLRECMKLLMPSVGIEPEEVDGALAAIPWVPAGPMPGGPARG